MSDEASGAAPLLSVAFSNAASCFANAAFLPLDIPISSCCFVSPRPFDQRFSLAIAKNGIVHL